MHTLHSLHTVLVCFCTVAMLRIVNRPKNICVILPYAGHALWYYTTLPSASVNWILKIMPKVYKTSHPMSAD